MFCTKCGIELTRQSKFCPNCGCDLNEKAPFCRGCGAQLPGLVRFCGECGTETQIKTAECPGCGKQLTFESVYCKYCGTKVQKNEPEVPEHDEDKDVNTLNSERKKENKVAADKTENVHTSGKKLKKKKEKKPRNKISKVAIIFLLLAAIAGGSALGYTLFMPKFDSDNLFQYNLMPVISGDTEGYGYINKRGEFVIPPVYKNAKPFAQNGLAAVETEKGWTYINTKNEIVMHEYYDAAESFGTMDYTVVTSQDGKQMLINSQGQVHFDENYTYDDLFNVYMDPAYQPEYVTFVFNVIPNRRDLAGIYVKEYGIHLLESRDSEFIYYSEGMVSFFDPHNSEDGNFVFYNLATGELLDTYYDFAGKFASNGLGLVGRYLYKDEFSGISVAEPMVYGYINKRGDEIIPLKYENAFNFDSSGLAAVKNDYWGYIDEKGNTVIPHAYHNVFYYDEEEPYNGLNREWNMPYGMAYGFNKEGLTAAFPVDGKQFVILNSDGEIKETLPPNISPITKDFVLPTSGMMFAVAEIDNGYKWAVVDENGEIIHLLEKLQEDPFSTIKYEDYSGKDKTLLLKRNLKEKGKMREVVYHKGKLIYDSGIVD